MKGRLAAMLVTATALIFPYFLPETIIPYNWPDEG